MQPFKDLKSAAGLSELNAHLESRSYIEGVVPSEADVRILESLASAPDGKYSHVVRWYNHIQSFSTTERSHWPKSSGGITVIGGEADVANGAAADDEDIDLFGESDEEEDSEKERIKQERLKAYAEKKAKKPGAIAKSSIVLDIKPWDDETDMKEMEKLIRGIETDGLVWGGAKLVPVAYGIQKLQIMCIVEDDKVGTDFLEDTITEFEDYVQSVDIAAFQKI